MIKNNTWQEGKQLGIVMRLIHRSILVIIRMLCLESMIGKGSKQLDSRQTVTTTRNKKISRKRKTLTFTWAS